MAQPPRIDLEMRLLIRLYNLFLLTVVYNIASPILFFFTSAFLYQSTWRFFEYIECMRNGKPECWSILPVDMTYCFKKDTIAETSAAREEGRFHECLLHTVLPFYTLVAVRVVYYAMYVTYRLFGWYDWAFDALDYPLHFAVKYNYYPHLGFYVDGAGSDVNLSEPKYNIRTPLNYVHCNEPRIVKLLLGMGADIRKTDMNLMYRAVKTGNQETLRLLCNAGLDHIHSHDTMQVAAALGKSDVVKYLVQRPGARIDRPSGFYSPLHFAVRSQSVDTVKILLEAGANVLTRGCNGNTPLQVAARHRNRELASILINRMDNLEHTNWEGYTALHMAVKARNAVVTKLLLDSGANIRAKDYAFQSALHMACSDPHEDMLMIIELLLDKGARINDMTPNRYTAFHLAVQYQKLPTIQMLLRRGANPYIQTLTQETIVHHAAANKEDLEVLKFFISEGFDSSVRSQYTDPLISYAAQHGAFNNYLFLLRKHIRNLESDTGGYQVYRTMLATAVKSINYGIYVPPKYVRFETELLEQVEKQLAEKATSGEARIARAALKYMAIAEHKNGDQLRACFFELNYQNNLREYYNRCKNEVLELERLQLLDPVLEIITANDEELLNYAKLVDMRQKVWEHRDRFPLYHRLIREVFYPTVRIQEQRWQAEKIVCQLLDLPDATHLVADKILSYLQPSDLSLLDSPV